MRRTYGDGCGIAHGLDLVGERWSLLVVRELLLGSKRFSDLRTGLPNAGPNVLTERLRELERAGVIRRAALPPPASARVYELTEWGRGLEDIVLALGKWATRAPAAPPEAPVGLESTVLALGSLADPAALEDLRASVALRLGDQRFRIEVGGGRVEVARGEPARPDASLHTDLETLQAVLWGGRSLGDARRAGALRVAGDKGAVKRLLRAYRTEPGR